MSAKLASTTIENPARAASQAALGCCACAAGGAPGARMFSCHCAAARHAARPHAPARTLARAFRSPPPCTDGCGTPHTHRGGARGVVIHKPVHDPGGQARHHARQRPQARLRAGGRPARGGGERRQQTAASPGSAALQHTGALLLRSPLPALAHTPGSCGSAWPCSRGRWRPGSRIAGPTPPCRPGRQLDRSRCERRDSGARATGGSGWSAAAHAPERHTPCQSLQHHAPAEGQFAAAQRQDEEPLRTGRPAGGGSQRSAGQPRAFVPPWCRRRSCTCTAGPHHAARVRLPGCQARPLTRPPSVPLARQDSCSAPRPPRAAVAAGTGGGSPSVLDGAAGGARAGSTMAGG